MCWPWVKYMPFRLDGPQASNHQPGNKTDTKEDRLEVRYAHLLEDNYSFILLYFTIAVSFPTFLVYFFWSGAVAECRKIKTDQRCHVGSRCWENPYVLGWRFSIDLHLDFGNGSAQMACHCYLPNVFLSQGSVVEKCQLKNTFGTSVYLKRGMCVNSSGKLILFYLPSLKLSFLGSGLASRYQLSG